MRMMCFLVCFSASFFLQADAQTVEGSTENTVTTQLETDTTAQQDSNTATTAVPDTLAASESEQTQRAPKPFLSRPATTSASSVGGNAPVIGASNIVSMLLSLLLIILLIFVLAWFMRRMGGNTMLGSQAMKVVAALSLGPKEKVMLVEIAGEQILLGVTATQITHIKTYDQAVVGMTKGDAADFSTKFRQFLGKQSESDSQGTSVENTSGERRL